MCYIRKQFNKASIKDGMLLEFTNKVDKRKSFYLAVSCNAKTDKIILIDENNQGYSIDSLTNSLSLNDDVLTSVYDRIYWKEALGVKVSCRQNVKNYINLYDRTIRTLIYKKEILFMTEKELLKMLASQINKEIVLI